MARDIALGHHERWDGSGYPHGLAGDDIPLAARIMALADVYDALTSRRAYKDAFTHEVARSMIVADSRIHFDPNVVEAFLAEEEEFVRIRREFETAASGAGSGASGREAAVGGD
jgi:putative two-component system response regulator